MIYTYRYYEDDDYSIEISYLVNVIDNETSTDKWSSLVGIAGENFVIVKFLQEKMKNL